MVAGQIDRARIHMPPGHAKTETVTWRLPTYWWQHVDKRAKILVTCYNQTYAKELGWQVREFAREHGIGIREDSNAKDSFRTNYGGSFMATGVGATPTGRRFDLIIGDDPIKDRKTIESQITRDAMDQWWTQGIMSRLLPGGRVFLVFTRWHEDDLGGRLEARAKNGGDQYEVLILPAINAEGKALWPEVYPIEELERRKRNMLDKEGLRGWEALYQQNPTPREGAIFKVGSLRFMDPQDVPMDELKSLVRGWDLAVSQDSGDYSAGVKIGGPCKKNLFYLLDVTRGQWSYGERDREMLRCAQVDGPGCRISIPQDPNASGKQVAELCRILLQAYAVHTSPESGSKILRAEPIARVIEDGRLVVVRTEQTEELVEELRTFPNGKHDDMVDALSRAYSRLLDANHDFTVSWG